MSVSVCLRRREKARLSLTWPPNKVAAAAALILMVVLLLLMQELMLLPWDEKQAELEEARRRNEITRAHQQQSVN